MATLPYPPGVRQCRKAAEAAAKEDTELADVDTVMEEIKAAFAEEQERLERMRESDSDE